MSISKQPGSWRARSIETLSCDERADPVDRRIRDLTAKEFVDWLVKYKGLPEEARENVEVNLREQYCWHRLQGRLDRHPFAALVAQLLLLRRGTKSLERPE